MTRNAVERGSGNFFVDDHVLQQVIEKPERSLIGGNPQRRPRLPIPAEPASFFRWHGSSAAHLARLTDFVTAKSPLEVEIGSGDGRFIVDRAARFPARHFLAFEVQYQFALRLFRRVEQAELTNLWVSDDDARYTLPRLLPLASVQIWHILMPDPWWKRKHQQRRLFSPPFVSFLADRTAPGGVLRVETDVAGYADFIAELLTAEPRFAPHDPALGTLFAEDRRSKRQLYCTEHDLPIYKFYWRRR